jgi:hypothetical protein
MRQLHLLAGAVLLVFVTTSPRVRAADEVASNHRPVKEVASLRISVGTQGALPIYASADWSNPLPDITRAVLVLHGRLRNADVYFQSAKTAQTAAGEVGKATIMIVPQFLAGIDVDAYQLSPDTLRWSLEGWEGGDPAVLMLSRGNSSRRSSSTQSSPDGRSGCCRPGRNPPTALTPAVTAY